jgi:hypothetical protein
VPQKPQEIMEPGQDIVLAVVPARRTLVQHSIVGKIDVAAALAKIP